MEVRKSGQQKFDHFEAEYGTGTINFDMNSFQNAPLQDKMCWKISESILKLMPQERSLVIPDV